MRAQISLRELNKIVKEQAPSWARGRLEKEAESALAALFHESLDVEKAAKMLGIEMGFAEYHLEALRKRNFAEIITIGVVIDEGSSGPFYAITHDGREYAVKHRLV